MTQIKILLFRISLEILILLYASREVLEQAAHFSSYATLTIFPTHPHVLQYYKSSYQHFDCFISNFLLVDHHFHPSIYPVSLCNSKKFNQLECNKVEIGDNLLGFLLQISKCLHHLLIVLRKNRVFMAKDRQMIKLSLLSYPQL